VAAIVVGTAVVGTAIVVGTAVVGTAVVATVLGAAVVPDPAVVVAGAALRSLLQPARNAAPSAAVVRNRRRSIETGSWAAGGSR
jgi:hypothetical protein